MISGRFLFREKYQNCPGKIAPMTRFSAGKICTISAGKAGISQVTENFVGSAGYWNATLQFSGFPIATFGTENETTPLSPGRRREPPDQTQCHRSMFADVPIYTSIWVGNPVRAYAVAR